MKTIYYLLILPAIAMLSGCAKDQDSSVSAESGEDMVAVSLSAAGGAVNVTRADAMTDIFEVTFLVFNSSDQLVLYKSVDYGAGERIFLKTGTTYKVLAVANLDDSNCPNGDADTFLNDVATTADLTGKYIVAASQTVQELGKVVMCSELETLTIASTAPETITLRRVQSKIELNIYNKSDSAGDVLSASGSGVSLHSYYTDNIALGSFLVQESEDYPQTLPVPSSGYGKTASTSFSGITPELVTLGGNYYVKYSVEIYSFENRSGNATSLITSESDRKQYAPEFALEINLLGYTGGWVLNTFIFPGKGRDAESNSVQSIDDINNYDVNRNSIYHVNAIINSTDNISVDSRREYLETALWGGLESPSDGTWGDF